MKILRPLLGLVLGAALGLLYAWVISPVEYVDASPEILRADFKEQYRGAVAAAYASTLDLERARARLALLGDENSAAELSAQAQRMVSSAGSTRSVEQIAQLAQDLRMGTASLPPTAAQTLEPTLTASLASIPAAATLTRTPDITATSPSKTGTPAATGDTPSPSATATPAFEQTAFVPLPSSTFAPRPTFTPIPPPGPPFMLASQKEVCDPQLQPGLMQFVLLDARKRQVPGIEITVTWDAGEDHFFTGLKTERGNGYADFVMEPDTGYSVSIVESGTSIPNLTAPECSGPGGAYTGGWLLTFQRP